MNFEIGRWYKNSAWKEHKYVKYLNHNNISVFYSEKITIDNEHEYFSKSCDIRIATFEEATLKEIQPYLPEGHPDKKFVLPKCWYIQLTEENREDVIKWHKTKDEWSRAYTLESYYGLKNGIRDAWQVGHLPENSNVITYNQFKKYVLNQQEENFSYLDKLLSKWNIR